MNAQTGIVGAVLGVQAEQDRRYEVPNRLGMYLAEMQSMPMLRGLWLITGDSANGDALDVSHNARTLTANSTPVWSYDRYVVPMVTFAGGNNFSRASEAGLNISGTETYVASAMRGLSIGCWFYPTAAAAQTLLGKWSAAAGNYSYRLALTAGNQLEFKASANGTAVFTATGSFVFPLNAWGFGAVILTPSTSCAMYSNSEIPETVTTSVPASLYAGTAAFRVGADDGGNGFTGNEALPFLVGGIVTNERMSKLWRWGRSIFGV